MLPRLRPGDWLLVDPTVRRWPRRGSIVVITEPSSGSLAVKRVGAGPGDRVPFAGGILELAEDEAWLVSDATADVAAAAGYGEPLDSRRYGPVPLECLVARAWFRYGPLRRIGPIRRRGPLTDRSRPPTEIEPLTQR
jgi:signal peptidase I